MKQTIVFVVLILLLGVTTLAQPAKDVCSQGPVELKLAGSTWFLRIAGHKWEYVGPRWEAVERLIETTPIQSTFNTQRVLLYLGSIVSSGLGTLDYLWPSPACSITKGAARCDTTRLMVSGGLIGLGVYIFLKTEEWVHTIAVQNYNAMWELLCKP